MSAQLLLMQDIWKGFGGLWANRGVSFDLLAGEVHALLGENGAGKSTLMNVLVGLYRQDRGRIFLEGREVRFSSPRDAIRAGIGMVHQHFMLVEKMTVWENVALGMEGLGLGLKREEVLRRIEEASRRYSLEVDPKAHIWQLSVGERQRVEVLRTLMSNPRVLVLDEPTSVLTPQESEGLFRTLRRVREEGRGVIFISHKLREVMEVADRITVMRGGERVATLRAEEVSEERLAELMIGRKLRLEYSKPSPSGSILAREEVLRVEDLRVEGDRANLAVDGISLSVRGGTILGVAGVAGNGQRELVEAIAGLRRPLSGRIYLLGKDITHAPVRERIALGLSYIPAERGQVGLVGDLDLVDNVALKDYWKGGLSFDRRRFEERAGRLVREFDVRVQRLDGPVKNMSGGNMQRLLLARELSSDPVLVVAVHPTWGLDVAATEFVRERLLEERGKGKAILLISEDLEEIMALSDLIAVISRGKIMGILKPEEADERRIGLMMMGEREG